VSLGDQLRAYANRDGRGYPDWALRYMPLARGLGDGLRGARVLEIGANENGLARFAPVRPVAADLRPTHLAAARDAAGVVPVAADIARLPFPGASFDVVVCVDTFEHLAPETRSAAAAEILRVLRPGGVAAVTFPSGEAAARAERSISEAYRRHTGNTLGWLDEHAAMGLPNAAEIAALFARLAPGRAVRREGNAPLWVWKPLWRVMMCGWPGRGNAVFQAIARLLTPMLARVTVGTPYRTLLWIGPEERGP
jgi:SAM-dependent methyltransferase